MRVLYTFCRIGGGGRGASGQHTLFILGSLESSWTSYSCRRLSSSEVQF